MWDEFFNAAEPTSAASRPVNPNIARIFGFPSEDSAAATGVEKTCTTCEHFLPAMPPEEPCNPDGCGCTGYPPACDVRAAPAGAAFPINGCPSWQCAAEPIRA